MLYIKRSATIKNNKKCYNLKPLWGVVSRSRARAVNRGDIGSIPPAAVSKLRQFCSPPICLCLSEEKLNAGPFCPVSMPGEVKDPTQMCNL